MFSRALRTGRAAPLRCNVFSKSALVKRTVTTDAASANVRDAVPQVSFIVGTYQLVCGQLADDPGGIGG